MKKILSSFALLAIIAVSFPALASSLPVGGTQYYLSGAGINSTQSTIQLTSFKTPDGRNITMTMVGTVGYGALEPQTTSKIEDITFTGITQNTNGTATLTGVSRGVDFVYPYTVTASLAKAHSGGATFIITNTPSFYYDEFAMPGNANVTVWPFASTSPATKGYVDFVAFNGAAVINANTINKGVVQISTGQQAASSTNTGSTGAVLVVPASVATSTFNTGSSAYVIPTTNAAGKIDSNFLALGTTTPIGAFPAWQIGKQMFVSSTTGTSTFSVPSGITKVNIRLCAAGGGGGNSATTDAGAAGAGAGGYSENAIDLTGTSTVQFFIGTGGAGGTGGARGATGGSTLFGTNGFYMGSIGGQGGQQSNSPGGGGIGFGGRYTTAGSPGNPGITITGNSVFGRGGTSILGGGSYCSGGDGQVAGTGTTGGNGLLIISW